MFFVPALTDVILRATIIRHGEPASGVHIYDVAVLVQVGLFITTVQRAITNGRMPVYDIVQCLPERFTRLAVCRPVIAARNVRIYGRKHNR